MHLDSIPVLPLQTFKYQKNNAAAFHKTSELCTTVGEINKLYFFNLCRLKK